MKVIEIFGARTVRVNGLLTDGFVDGMENADFAVTILDGDKELGDGVVGCFTADTLDISDEGIVLSHRLSSNGHWLIPIKGTPVDQSKYGIDMK